MSLIAPKGYAAIVAMFGDPSSVTDDPKTELAWRRKIQAAADYPAPLNGDPKRTKIWCHRLLAVEIEGVLREIHAAGLWHLIKTIGCYNFRKARGLAHKLSTHCWGIALDINSATNALGTVGDMDPRIVAIFEKRGWTWGGRWSRRDDMHFQYCGAY